MRAVTDADDDNAGHHSTTTRATYRQLEGTQRVHMCNVQCSVGGSRGYAYQLSHSIHVGRNLPLLIVYSAHPNHWVHQKLQLPYDVQSHAGIMAAATTSSHATVTVFITL